MTGDFSGLPRPMGPYLCLAQLGAGAAGAAYLARPLAPDSGVPTPFVLKVMHAALAARPEFVARFRHEAEVAVAVESPHVAAVFDVGQHGDELYIAMEFVPGWTLGRVMHAIERNKVQAPLPVAHALVEQALAGLDALHDARSVDGAPLGVIHRDVSPKNIMVGEDGRARVIDLGLMKTNAQEWQTTAGRVMGSPGYMAPEQMRGRPLDRRADLFAMGTILHELLIGARLVARAEPLEMLRAALALEGPPRPSAVRAGLSRAVDEVVATAMAHDPQARYPDAAAFRRGLRAALGEPAPPEGVQAFLQHVLGAEFEARRREVARLLAQPWEEALEPTVVPTRIFVRRPGIAPEPEGQALVATRVVGNPLAAPVWPSPAEAMMLSYPGSQSHGLRRAQPTAWRWAVGLVAVAVAGLGVALGAWVRSAGRSVAIPQAPPAAVAPIERPAVVPRAPEVTPAPQVEAAPVELAAPAASPRPAPLKPRPEPARATPAQASRPEAPVDRVQALFDAALRLKASLHEGDPRRADMDRLLARLTLLKAAGPGAASDALLDGLEAELGRLSTSP